MGEGYAYSTRFGKLWQRISGKIWQGLARLGRIKPDMVGLGKFWQGLDCCCYFGRFLILTKFWQSQHSWKATFLWHLWDLFQICIGLTSKKFNFPFSQRHSECVLCFVNPVCVWYDHLFQVSESEWLEYCQSQPSLTSYCNQLVSAGLWEDVFGYSR